jgi:hypothetical protein
LSVVSSRSVSSIVVVSQGSADRCRFPKVLVGIGTSREGGFAGDPAGGGGYSNAGLDWSARECLLGSVERCGL